MTKQRRWRMMTTVSQAKNAHQLPKILLVEDDLMIADQVKGWLENSFNWTVESVNCGEDALQLSQSFGFDLIILDYGLPGISGIDVCQTLRKYGLHTPIIFLTGQGQIEDKEKGFLVGADDYLTKPFELRELSARCNALLRRPARIAELVCDDERIRLDSETKILHVDDAQIKLSKMEFAFLAHMIRNPNKVFPAQDILKAVWPSDKESSEEAVRTLVKALRVKLSAANCERAAKLVETVPGSGYVLRVN